MRILVVTLLIAMLCALGLWSNRDTSGPRSTAPQPKPATTTIAFDWDRLWKVLNPRTNSSHRIASITVRERTILVEHKNIPALLELQGHESSQVRRAADQALAQLAGTPRTDLDWAEISIDALGD